MKSIVFLMEKNNLPVESILPFMDETVLCVEDVLLHRDYILTDTALLRSQVEVNVQTLTHYRTVYLCLHCKRISNDITCPHCLHPIYREIPVDFPHTLTAECMDCKGVFKGKEIYKHTQETGHQKFLA